MTRAQKLLNSLGEKGLLKDVLKGAAYGAGGAVLLHVGKKFFGGKNKFDKKVSTHSASFRKKGHGSYE